MVRRFAALCLVTVLLLCCVAICVAATPGAMVVVDQPTNESAPTEMPAAAIPGVQQAVSSSKTTNAFRCQRSIESLSSFSTRDAKGFQIDALDSPGSPGKRNANCMFDYLEVINASLTINCYRPHSEIDTNGNAAESGGGDKEGCYAKIKFNARVPDVFTSGDSLMPTIDDEARYDLRLENLMPIDKSRENETQEGEEESASDKILNSVRNAIHYKGSKEDVATGDHAGYSLCCALLDEPHASCKWVSTPATEDREYTKRLLPKTCGIHELNPHSIIESGNDDPGEEEEEDLDDPLGLNAMDLQYNKLIEEALRRQHNKDGQVNEQQTKEGAASALDETSSFLSATGDVNEVSGYHIISGTVEKPLHRDKAGVWRAELNFHRAPLISASAKAIADDHPTYKDMSVRSGKAGRITFSMMLTDEEMGKKHQQGDSTQQAHSGPNAAAAVGI